MHLNRSEKVINRKTVFVPIQLVSIKPSKWVAKQSHKANFDNDTTLVPTIISATKAGTRPEMFW